MKFKDQEKYNIDDLLEVMRALRGEGGCPWDRVQTHKSIRRDFLEEAYEVADAIDREDEVSLCEELGDVLQNVIFQARIAEEEGKFDFSDVCDGICRKMILRHPHVFGEVRADTPEAVLDNWDKIKSQEKSLHSVEDTMNAVARSLPSLIRAEKVQKKAAKAGFDWQDSGDTHAYDGAFDKVAEELDEVREAMDESDADVRRAHVEEEIGDLLFAAVNASRLLKVDAEHALECATDKFIRRFSAMEKAAAAQDRELSALSPDEWEELWAEEKQCEAKEKERK